MKRKIVFWASISLAIVLAHSCRLPSAVQINADNFGLSVPLRAEADFSAMFRGIIEDAFDGNDAHVVRVFDMVDVGPAMTFLVAFELEDMLPSFNPGDYLGDFADHNADGITSINHSVRAPQLSWSPAPIEIPLSYFLPGLPPGTPIGPERREVPLPPQVVEAIEAASDAWAELSGFLNADVDSGSFDLRATFRASDFSSPVNLNVSGEIIVSQDAASLGGEPFHGLCESEPWGFSAGRPHNLRGSSLNGKPIKVHPESFLVFSGTHLAGGGTVQLEMNLAIEVLEWIRLDPQDNEDFAIDPIEVNFAAMHGRNMSIADFIQEITLSETEMSLAVSRLHPALNNNVKLAVTSETLGFDGEQKYLRSVGTTFTGSGVTLDFEEIIWLDGAIVPIKVDLVPPNGRYFELGPINLAGNGGLYIHATVGLDFEWESAKINTGWIVDDDILSGSILDEPINLGDTLGDFMSGFAFAEGSLELSMFLEGAPDILDIVMPKLSLSAVFDEYGTDYESLFQDRPLITGAIPSLPPGASWVGYLPPGGLEANMGGFITKISDRLPEYLRFSYAVTFGDEDGTIDIRPEHFGNGYGGDDEVRVMIMMKLALDFNVSAGGSINLPLFEDSEDIFGRDGLSDPLFGNDYMDIRMLMLRLYFDYSIFHGAVLHLDANRNLFPNGLALDDGTGNLEVRIEGNDFDIINRHLIPPDVRIVYPQERNLRITRDLIPTRIAIAVSGSYTLEL